MSAIVWWLKVALFCGAAFQGVVTGTEVQCEAGQLQCKDRTECYQESVRCDGAYDCFDGSDEENCDTSSCTEDQFTCDSDQCIAKDLECNGNRDCDDGSDEVQCDASSCEEHEFMCVSDHRCVNALHRCDGQFQCQDHSDEANCTVQVSSREPAIAAGSRHSCATDEFDCRADGTECIPLSARCDKNIDCSNEADESMDDCPSPNEVIEEQNQGDEMDTSAGHSCEDSMCAQICADAEEVGYRCSCHEGYTLANDSHNCNVANSSGVEMLWVTDGSKLGRFEIYRGKYMEDDVGHQMSALDVDYRHKKAYFISSDSIYEMNADLSEVTSLIVSTAELRPAALGYDWIHKNLYWSTESKIEVVSVARKLRRSLIVSPNVTYAVSIAIDPRASQGYIYWGQGADARPGIYRAGLDGSNPVLVVGTGVERPSAMTIDFIHGDGNLLWLDSYANTIRSYDMASGQNSVVFSIGAEGQSTHVTGLAYLSGHLYWADRSRGTVYTVHEDSVGADSSEPTVESVLDDLSLPRNLVIFNLVKQPSGHNRCSHNNGGCSHICLPTPASASVRHRCFCPNVGTTHTYKLNTDHKTCSEHAASGVHRSSSGKQQSTKSIGVGEVMDGDADGQAVRGSATAVVGLSAGLGAGAVVLTLLIGLLVACKLKRLPCQQRKPETNVDAKSAATAQQMDSLLNGKSSSSSSDAAAAAGAVHQDSTVCVDTAA